MGPGASLVRCTGNCVRRAREISDRYDHKNRPPATAGYHVGRSQARGYAASPKGGGSHRMHSTFETASVNKRWAPHELVAQLISLGRDSGSATLATAFAHRGSGRGDGGRRELRLHPNASRPASGAGPPSSCTRSRLQRGRCTTPERQVFGVFHAVCIPPEAGPAMRAEPGWCLYDTPGRNPQVRHDLEHHALFPSPNVRVVRL